MNPLVIEGITFGCWDQGNGALYIGFWPGMFNSVGGLDGSKALEYTSYASWAPGYKISFSHDAIGIEVDINSGSGNLRVRAYKGGISGQIVFEDSFAVPGQIIFSSNQPFDTLHIGETGFDDPGYFSIDNFKVIYE
jgi:hypothetical protein